jgi:hypothetical protein
MSWLNANDYLTMDLVARERVDDLRSSTDDVALARAEEGESPCADADGVLSRAWCGVVTCGPRTPRGTLNPVLRATR